MEVISPRRLLHPIMEENFNSAGELSEDETRSNCSEYSENLFLSEDSLEVSDNERTNGDLRDNERTNGDLRDNERTNGDLRDYFVSSLTRDVKFVDESTQDALFGHKSTNSPLIALRSDWSTDSGDFSCDSLNQSCDSCVFVEEDLISLDEGAGLGFFESSAKPNKIPEILSEPDLETDRRKATRCSEYAIEPISAAKKLPSPKFGKTDADLRFLESEKPKKMSEKLPDCLSETNLKEPTNRSESAIKPISTVKKCLSPVLGKTTPTSTFKSTECDSELDSTLVFDDHLNLSVNDLASNLCSEERLNEKTILDDVKFSTPNIKWEEYNWKVSSSLFPKSQQNVGNSSLNNDANLEIENSASDSRKIDGIDSKKVATDTKSSALSATEDSKENLLGSNESNSNRKAENSSFHNSIPALRGADVVDFLSETKSSSRDYVRSEGGSNLSEVLFSKNRANPQEKNSNSPSLQSKPAVITKTRNQQQLVDLDPHLVNMHHCRNNQICSNFTSADKVSTSKELDQRIGATKNCRDENSNRISLELHERDTNVSTSPINQNNSNFTSIDNYSKLKDLSTCSEPKVNLSKQNSSRISFLEPERIPDTSLLLLDSLDHSFDRDSANSSASARDLSASLANESVDRTSGDVTNATSDDGFFESLNQSFNEMNDNLQSIKQLSMRKFEDTLALRGYLENCESYQALLEKYVSLKNQAEGIQTELKLKKEMAQLKDDIIALAENVLSSGTDNIDRNELEKYINQMKKELECLHERKLKLTLVNLKVHQFKTESGVPVDDLKAEVAKLYQIWDYNYNRVSSQLESLQRVSNIWKQFEAHRNEFLSALGDDEKTIQLLDNALQDGDISPEIATSVRVVAKVLSEKRDDNSPPESLCETLSGATSLLDPCSGEGSLSDSGISDSGSEQDICEREKRLGEMRKLAKEMDLLSPGSLFAMDVNKRVQEMEAKLRELQRNCRNLIVKTAVCAETGCPAAPKKQFHLTPSKRCRSPVLKGELATADDGDDGDKPSQFWRILKCSMPFHLAIMLLVCVACLLEPHCCDSLNNFHRSIAPQMRYLYGPPPI